MDGATLQLSPAALQRLAAQAARVQTEAMDIPSPCINVCRIDPVRSVCHGCFRTLDEIAAWGMSDDNTKRQVWARIARRLPVPASPNATP